MVMQSNMTMMKHGIINGTVESCMAIISQNGYGNAIIGRHGGFFEEAHHWNIQAKFYNVKFPLVYESDNIGDSLS